MAEIVVGGDGSGPSAVALRWAAERLLLGSVSDQVAHHAPCPVVVVPPESPEEVER